MSSVIPIYPDQVAEAKVAQADIHIASLVLQVTPENLRSVESAVHEIPECTCYSDHQDSTQQDSTQTQTQINSSSNKNALVVVAEVNSQEAVNRIIDQLKLLPGVLNVNLVYHHCDSPESMKDELELKQ